MGLVIDNHCHISSEVPGRREFSWQQSWLVCMQWAYGPYSPNKGRPPFTRDPSALFPRQGLRYADPEGVYTIAAMDKGGIDMGVMLPEDYDFSWGSHADIGIEEKHEHQYQMIQKYPGRFVHFGGPDPRRPGAKEIFRRAITQYGAKGLKLMPKNGYHPWQDECYELYDVCMEFGLPMSTCTEPNAGGYNWGRFSDPMDLLDVIGDFPDMPLTLLHAGDPLFDYFEKSLFVASGNVNTYIELNFWLKPAAGVEGIMASGPFFGFPPGFGHNLNEEVVVLMLARARDILGAHKITWGIDTHFGAAMRNTGWKVAPWLKGLTQTAAKYGKQFSQDEVDLILGENVARVLKLKEYPEWKMERKYGYTRRDPRPRYR
ncbi:MAG: amidohydrolase family protein [Chloroflexi bacterium]|nr:amidohydrolase family protein [Chloroflexota bacterium]